MRPFSCVLGLSLAVALVAPAASQQFCPSCPPERPGPSLRPPAVDEYPDDLTRPAPLPDLASPLLRDTWDGPRSQLYLRWRGGGDGTATTLEFRDGRGLRLLLTAGHCTDGGSLGDVFLPEGRSVPVELLARDRQADLALLAARLDGPRHFARLSRTRPVPGARLFQAGLGAARRERIRFGLTLGPTGTRGLFRYRLCVGAGDSGAGIFDRQSRELVGVVSGYDRTQTYGSDLESIWRLVRSASGKGATDGPRASPRTYDPPAWLRAK